MHRARKHWISSIILFFILNEKKLSSKSHTFAWISLRLQHAPLKIIQWDNRNECARPLFKNTLGNVLYWGEMYKTRSITVKQIAPRTFALHNGIRNIILISGLYVHCMKCRFRSQNWKGIRNFLHRRTIPFNHLQNYSTFFLVELLNTQKLCSCLMSDSDETKKNKNKNKRNLMPSNTQCPVSVLIFD